MKNFIILSLILILSGCATTREMAPTGLIPFTATSFVERSEYNEHVRTYHIRYSGWPAAEIAAWFGKVGMIDGVADIGMINYAFIVTKSPAYSWDEIEPKIKAVIEEFEKAEPAEVEPEETTMKRRDGV